MKWNAYLSNILAREHVDTSLQSPIRLVQAELEPVIKRWAKERLVGIEPSGSFAKGTANSSATDLDLFISLSDQTCEPMRDIFDSLYEAMEDYSPTKRNVAINVRIGCYSIDLVPGKRQGSTPVHLLFSQRSDSWIETDISYHVGTVKLGKRSDEIRILKLWRDQRELIFPSFYLELSVLKALPEQREALSKNMVTLLEYLKDRFVQARVVDPSNADNVISDELNQLEKLAIQRAAHDALWQLSITNVVS